MEGPSSTYGLPEPWLTKRQLARHYGYSTRWVELQQRAGLPSHMIGGQRRYRLSETDPHLMTASEKESAHA
jgi:hypothetical protein